MLNSGRIAGGAALAALVLVLSTVFIMDDRVLVALAGAAALAYVASVWDAFARRRHVVVVLGGVGTVLAIASSVAFLLMWGLASSGSTSALEAGVTGRDSDKHFYRAAIASLLTLAVLLSSAVWPSRKVRPPSKPKSPARNPATRSSGTTRSTPNTRSTKKPTARKTASSAR